MNERVVRWGILGTGGIAAAMAADIACVPEDARVVAVASRSKARADEFAKRFNLPQAFGSYEELCAADLDVVYVATPHSDHLASGLLALAAGKHVLVEKPLTPTPHETEQLLNAAASANRFCMEAVWMRCNPLIRLAAELVQEGELGEIRQLSASFGFPFDGGPKHRLLNPKLAGGGILDLGVYPAHLFELLLGRPASVVALGSLAATGVDANTTALFHYPATGERGPAQAIAYCSIEAVVQQRAEVCGTKARLELDDFVQPTTMRLVTADGTAKEYAAQPIGRGLANEALEVGRCVRAGLLESSLVGWAATRNVAGMLASWRKALDQKDHRMEVV